MEEERGTRSYENLKGHIQADVKTDGSTRISDTRMEQVTANPNAASRRDLLILHTAEAQEWATYLNVILTSSRTFLELKPSILLHALSPHDRLHGYSFEHCRSSKCIVLILTSALLDLLKDTELNGALQRLLRPPRSVVALLCGVSEEDIPDCSFEHWPNWRKLHAEDAAVTYISTILEAMTASGVADNAKEAPETAVSSVSTANQNENEVTEELEKNVSAFQTDQDHIEAVSQEETSAKLAACLTVQPKRVLCGEQTTLFIILLHKVDCQSKAEVEFVSENVAPKRIPATIENEYTISVATPDMPAGQVSLTLLTDSSSISLTSVTYHTSMDEVSRHLENATSPMEFICQAFNITSQKTEYLDSMLTDLLRSRMPAGGLRLFGIKEVEVNNMATYQRNEELPTLLHFAARYGLKKLTTELLHCPGALQAYSVMNKNGDYPNTLAERYGFTDLRQFIDEFLETADMLTSHIRDSITEEEEVYEQMVSGDIIDRYSGHSEDIYESMVAIDPDCAEDMYEVMNGVETLNPEELMLRKFFQGKPNGDETQDGEGHFKAEDTDEDSGKDLDHCEKEEEEESIYMLGLEDICDVVDGKSYSHEVLNRPPAPVPRTHTSTQMEPIFISRVFQQTIRGKREPTADLMQLVAQSAMYMSRPPMYDPYAGMKTPGQRQLIDLQERVKLGLMSVDEAVQKFKSWQFDHGQRSNSIRYQQENLKKLRDSIRRRHRARQKIEKNVDYKITAPLPRNSDSGGAGFEYSVYESSPSMVAPPPAASNPIERGNWKTGSTSSTSSNRSSLSVNSSSSGTEPDFEDALEVLRPPPPPPRSSSGASNSPPPSIPRRVPESIPEEMLTNLYVSCPKRALPQIPTHGASGSPPPPPIPRRPR